eukprot:Skav206936  [mRNA]  locus=scaffold1247:116115:121573:+ [translate_table: standard]
MTGDLGPAYNAELWEPSGLALDKDQKFLYLADYGSHRVRRINLEQMPLNIGGAVGQITKGDGGVALLARMQDGTLPVNVYITETGGQQVRTMSLEFQSYLGVINTLTGTGQRGDQAKEGSPLEAPLAELNEPTGVEADEGGSRHCCWFVFLCNGESLPWGLNYLTGVPENRPDAITAHLGSL